MVEGISNILSDGSIYVDVGPVQMRVHVWQGERPRTDLARAGADKAYYLLEELSEHRGAITSNILVVNPDPAYPRVVNRMIESVRKTGDASMTPLAAVAGTVADEVADFICGLEPVTKVVVNNGGDIAIRLQEGASVRIGVQEDLSRSEFSNVLVVDGSHGIRGVATSGMGGRSFTKGIASAVTIAAPSGSLADAAATLIGNAVNVLSPNIKKVRAEEIDPDTDIPGHLVTVSVGELSDREVERALASGMEMAGELRRRGLIAGAILALKGAIVISSELRPMVHPAAVVR